MGVGFGIPAFCAVLSLNVFALVPALSSLQQV